MNSDLKKISADMLKRYSDRFHKLGRDVKTLGWGNEEQQLYRFQQTFSAFDSLTNYSILDIGCGFGDYLAAIKSQNKNFDKYIGWDINPDLINEAKEIWKTEVLCAFHSKNLLETEVLEEVADVVIMLGVLNLNFNGTVDNYQYSFDFIEKAFSATKKVLAVDFLSSYRSKAYPKEDFVFYHDPAKMLEHALKLTPNVILKHNYSPIPQKEFMLFLYK
jgi:SAM-dependent methyltransferase